MRIRKKMFKVLYKSFLQIWVKLFLILSILLVTSPLFAINFYSDIGASIPVGNWANYHNSSPFISFGINLIKKDYMNSGFAFDISSFSGKLNDNYILQVFSPGISMEFFPLFFIQNHTIFVNSTTSYSFMKKRLHNATEGGRDFSISNLLGAKIKISEHWSVCTYFGEKHFAGRIDMLILGAGLGFKK